MQRFDAVAINDADDSAREVCGKDWCREEEDNHKGGTSASRQDRKLRNELKLFPSDTVIGFSPDLPAGLKVRLS